MGSYFWPPWYLYTRPQGSLASTPPTRRHSARLSRPSNLTQPPRALHEHSGERRGLSEALGASSLHRGRERDGERASRQPKRWRFCCFLLGRRPIGRRLGERRRAVTGRRLAGRRRLADRRRLRIGTVRLQQEQQQGGER